MQLVSRCRCHQGSPLSGSRLQLRTLLRALPSYHYIDLGNDSLSGRFNSCFSFNSHTVSLCHCHLLAAFLAKLKYSMQHTGHEEIRMPSAGLLLPSQCSPLHFSSKAAHQPVFQDSRFPGGETQIPAHCVTKPQKLHRGSWAPNGRAPGLDERRGTGTFGSEEPYTTDLSRKGLSTMLTPTPLDFPHPSTGEVFKSHDTGSKITPWKCTLVAWHLPLKFCIDCTLENMKNPIPTTLCSGHCWSLPVSSYLQETALSRKPFPCHFSKVTL